MSIESIVAAQRAYFASGATLPLTARRTALEALLREVTAREGQLLQALKDDLNKSPFEGYMTEVGLVRDELRFHLKHLARWTRPRRTPTPLAQFPARSCVLSEPYGVALVLAPWNYPIQLALEPLTGALSAGNCAVVKPSAYAPAASAALAELIGAALPPELAAVVEGGRAENQSLLDQTFDYIFFTGGVEVGRQVMEKAAKNLTPVTLELGGKSPCIVTKSADLRLAARRIAFGKLLNAGQTCVAPDYLLVERPVKGALVAALEQEIAGFLGTDPLSNPDYPKIINEKHFHRLTSLLEGTHILAGGQWADGRIAPTLVDGVSGDAPLMQEEIFGPILPVLTFDDLEEVLDFVSARPNPLALYLFTRDREAERLILSRLSFGGGCVNDTVIHLATPHMPFGGVGSSGMGGYHGKASFDTFSHQKSVVKKAGWLDLPVRYHPYTPQKERLLRRFLR